LMDGSDIREDAQRICIDFNSSTERTLYLSRRGFNDNTSLQRAAVADMEWSIAEIEDLYRCVVALGAYVTKKRGAMRLKYQAYREELNKKGFDGQPVYNDEAVIFRAAWSDAV
jgi:hypothetical protein